MTKIQGKLVKPGKVWMVQIVGKKGTADHQIPMAARYFEEADAVEGLEVDVERDTRGQITKVSIPGKEQGNPQLSEAQAKKISQPKSGHRSGNAPKPMGKSPLGNRSNMSKASAKALGSPFHNPYTFIPFPQQEPKRAPFTLQSADETQNANRYTGLLRLKVTTLSPLLTCESTPVEGDRQHQDEAAHQTYRALTIANDVVLPATGVRGALRTLLTIISGGTLGYLNTETILCQGRDLNLGPRGEQSPPHVPQNLHMAEVIDPGNSRKPGRIRVGVCQLVSLEELENVFPKIDDKKYRDPKNSTSLWVELDSRKQPIKVVESKDRPQGNFGRLRLSGKPINLKHKREAVFFSKEQEPIQLPARFWSDYAERHKHGDRPNLKKGDLVWLMPHEPTLAVVRSEEDIQSLQWARWGRHGQKLQDLIDIHNPQVYPDYLREDTKVDTVTDLFGQVPPNRESTAPTFAGRIMPDNLVFYGAKFRMEKNVTLAPLSQPHPSCIAFYRMGDDPDKISDENGLKGYKVYRTTKQRGQEAPWHFRNQGVYGDGGQLEPAQHKMNKTVDLLPEDQIGYLNLSFHALSTEELALLIQSTEVTWRLGGGKPLGLGHCRIEIIDLLDELGQPLKVPGWSRQNSDQGTLKLDGWQTAVSQYQQRLNYWIASQTPVEKLAYPRAVDQNNHRKTRGGHVWFQRFAQPKMGEDKGGKRKQGLSPVYIDGQLMSQALGQGASLDLQEPMIAAQTLPALSPDDQTADLLYGYDLYPTKKEKRTRPLRNVYLAMEPFDPTRHAREDDRSSGNDGKNRGSRRDNKKRE